MAEALRERPSFISGASDARRHQRKINMVSEKSVRASGGERLLPGEPVGRDGRVGATAARLL